MYEFNQTLFNLTFNVVAIRYESPWITLCALANGARLTNRCRRPGLSVEAVSMLAQMLGFKYKVLWVSTYSDVEDSIANGSADFSLTFMTATAERWKKYNFLDPLSFIESGFMGVQPKPTITQMPLSKPFHLYTWLSLLAVFVLTLLCLVLIARLPAGLVPDTFFRLIAFTMKQENLNSIHRGVRRRFWLNLVTLLYSLFALLIRVLYCGLLIAFLYPIQKGHPFTDSGELAGMIASGTRILYARAPLAGLYFYRINHSDSEGHLRMRQALFSRPPVQYKAESDLVPALLKHHDYVAPITSLAYAYLTRNTTSTCSIQYVKDNSLVDTWESIMMRKDFPYAKHFHRVLRGGLRDMLWQVALRNYYYSNQELSACNSRHAKPFFAIQFTPNSSIVQIWSYATVCAVLAFLLEKTMALCAEAWAIRLAYFSSSYC